MDPITEMQHRVELVVTATIDTVEALASASKPDEARVAACIEYVTRETARLESSIDTIPVWAESTSELYARMKALADEDAALDDAIAALLGPAEAALLQSRAHLNEVTDSAFAVHLRQEAEKGAPVPPSA